MSNSLRVKLERRKETSARSSSRNTKVNTTNLNSTTSDTDNNIQELEPVEVYLNLAKSTGEWNVGGKLWELLTQAQKDMLTKIRSKGRGVNLKKTENNMNNNLKVVDTILKHPEKSNHSAKINTINTSSANDSEEENSMSFIEYMIQNTKAEIHMEQATNNIASINNIQYNASMIVCKANLQYIARLARHKNKSLCIVDGGADTHVFGHSWLPLFTVGPHTKRQTLLVLTRWQQENRIYQLDHMLPK